MSHQMVAHTDKEPDQQVAVQQHEAVRCWRWQGLSGRRKGLVRAEQDAMRHLHPAMAPFITSGASL